MQRIALEDLEDRVDSKWHGANQVLYQRFSEIVLQTKGVENPWECFHTWVVNNGFSEVVSLIHSVDSDANHMKNKRDTPQLGSASTTTNANGGGKGASRDGAAKPGFDASKGNSEATGKRFSSGSGREARKFTGKCNYCEKVGHMAVNCRTRISNEKDGTIKNVGKAKVSFQGRRRMALRYSLPSRFRLGRRVRAKSKTL